MLGMESRYYYLQVKLTWIKKIQNIEINGTQMTIRQSNKAWNVNNFISWKNSKIEYDLHKQNQWNILEKINFLSWKECISALFQGKRTSVHFWSMDESAGRLSTAILHTHQSTLNFSAFPLLFLLCLPSLSFHYFPIFNLYVFLDSDIFLLSKSAFIDERKVNRSYQSSFTYLSSLAKI